MSFFRIADTPPFSGRPGPLKSPDFSLNPRIFRLRSRFFFEVFLCFMMCFITPFANNYVPVYFNELVYQEMPKTIKAFIVNKMAAYKPIDSNINKSCIEWTNYLLAGMKSGYALVNFRFRTCGFTRVAPDRFNSQDDLTCSKVVVVASCLFQNFPGVTYFQEIWLDNFGYLLSAFTQLLPWRFVGRGRLAILG